LGVKLLICSPETNDICRDKRNTAAYFERVGVRTPRLFDADAVLADPNAHYPLLMKPADGSSSVGVTKVRNRRELEFFKDYVPNAILQEFLVGEEYTMDVLLDLAGRVRCIVPRLRMETRAGEVSKGMTVKHRAIMAETLRVAQSLPGAIGCITIQCFVDSDGGIQFTEINPRFGGGAPLSFAAGADYPRWILEMMLGVDSDIQLDSWVDGVVMLRYDDAVYTTRESIA
jgi:carbamoyl-phosphate synthase large subunit